MRLYDQNNFLQILVGIIFCRPTMDLYKKTSQKYLKKTMKNRLIIAIIYTTLQHFSFKI